MRGGVFITDDWFAGEGLSVLDVSYDEESRQSISDPEFYN